MRKAFGLILAGLGAVTLTGAVAAASQDAHVQVVGVEKQRSPSPVARPLTLAEHCKCIGSTRKSRPICRVGCDGSFSPLECQISGPLDSGVVVGRLIAGRKHADDGSTSTKCAQWIESRRQARVGFGWEADVGCGCKGIASPPCLDPNDR